MRRGRGFTLLELVLVISIVALGMAIAVPVIDGGLEAREVRRAAREVAAAMHSARARALATGKVQRLTIDPLRSALSLGGAEIQLPGRAAIDGVEGGWLQGRDAVVVVFYPNGSATRTEVVVASRSDPHRRRYRVSLDPLLGTVAISDETA